jgi:membrane-associated phospholipid phosphatase
VVRRFYYAPFMIEASGNHRFLSFLRPYRGGQLHDGEAVMMGDLEQDESLPAPREHRWAWWPYLMAAALAVLVGASIVVSGNHWQQITALGDCAGITNDAGRLACYDRFFPHPPVDPARGASPPVQPEVR